MSVGLVVAEGDAVGMREAGDSATVVETIGAADGSETLTQRVIHFGPGKSQPRGDVQHDDLLYVVSGSGSIELYETSYPVAAGTAAHMRAGDAFVIDNDGTDDLVLVSVLVPASPGGGRPD